MTMLFYLCVESVALLFMLGANCGFNVSRKRARKRELFFLCPENAKIEGTRRVSYAVWKVKGYDALFFLSFFVLFLVIALRDEVGTDYLNYVEVYSHIIQHTETPEETSWLGRAFVYLCRVIGWFAGENYFAMFAITGAATMLFLSKAIYHLSPNWLTSLYMFLCFCLYYQCFNQIRQMLAMSVTTYALRFLKEGKPARFAAYVICASFFHPSAIVTLTLLFVWKWRINWKRLSFYFFACCISWALYPFLIVLISYTPYAGYLQSQWNVAFQTSALFNFAVRIAMLIFCLLFSKETLRRKPGLTVLYHSAIICTVLQVMTLRASFFGRTTTYFYMAYLFLIPETMITVERHLNREAATLFRSCVILLLLAYHFVYYSATVDSAGVGTYKMLLFH